MQPRIGSNRGLYTAVEMSEATPDRYGARARALLIVLGGLLSGLVLLSALRQAGGVFLFPLDDSFIYLQYAVRLAEGHPFSYGPGEPPSTGMTSLLYPVLVAPGALLGLRGEGLALFAFGVDAIFLLGSALLVRRLLRSRLPEAAASGSAALVLLTGPFLWGALSGMEIGMTAFFFLASADLLRTEMETGRLRFAPAALALLALARPEAMLFAVAVALALAIPTPGAATRQLAGRAGLLFPLAAAAATVGVNLALTGHLSPDSSRPKSPFFTPEYSPLFHARHALSFLAVTIRGLLTGAFGPPPAPGTPTVAALPFVPPLAGLVFAVGAFHGVRAEWREKRFGPHALLAGWFLFGLSAVTVLSGSAVHHFRYLLPFLPAFVALLVPGACTVAAWLSRLTPRLGAPRLAVLLSALLFAFQLVSTVEFLGLYGRESRGLLEYRTAALWMKENLPPGTRTAVLDAGVVGFLAERPLVDLFGLTTAALAPSSVFFADWIGSKYETLASWPRERRPRHLLAHKVRYDERGDEGHLAPLRTRPVVSFGAPPPGVPTIGIDLTIWEIDWGRLAPTPQPCTAAGREAAGGRLVDSLNVADVEDEARHRRRFESRRPGVFGSNRLAVAACGPGMTAADGARGVPGAEVFEMEVPEPAALRLVLRAAFARGPVEIEVDGVRVGAVAVGTDPSQWTEAVLEIPRENVRRGRNRFRASGEFLSARYWLYRKDR